MNATKNPPPVDQGLAFQTHALQMILLGPFHVRIRHRYGPPRIVSLQLQWIICIIILFNIIIIIVVELIYWIVYFLKVNSI